MQCSWYVNNQSLELTAYEEIAKSYFYLQNCEKAEWYSKKVQHGQLEHPYSHERLVSIELWDREIKMRAKQNKWMKLCFDVYYKGRVKVIDNTKTDFKEIWDVIDEINLSRTTMKKIPVLTFMNKINNHKMCGKAVNVATPLFSGKILIPSPTNDPALRIPEKIEKKQDSKSKVEVELSDDEYYAPLPVKET